MPKCIIIILRMQYTTANNSYTKYQQSSPQQPRSLYPSQTTPSKIGLMGGSNLAPQQMANYYPQYNPNYRQQPQVPSDMPLGLANLGNTCYINSILQVLFQIFNFPMSSNMGPLTQLYVQLRQSHSYVTNTEFKKQLEKHLEFTKGTHQQDAQQFLRGLLEVLNKENCRNSHSTPDFKFSVDLKLSVYNNWYRFMKEMQLHDNSEVIDYFGGETITEVKCQHGHSRYTFDRFMDMSLSFPTLDRIYSVSDLLRWNLRPEYIENLECDTCQSKQTSIKSTLMYNSPPILVIHINRFYQGPHKNDKISIPVNFDEILEVPGSVLHDDVKRSKVIYQLIGVVNHYGVINSGHYYSDVRGAQGKWYQCNDETVVETKLLRQDNTSEYTYMLFYRKLQ